MKKTCHLLSLLRQSRDVKVRTFDLDLDSLLGGEGGARPMKQSTAYSHQAGCSGHGVVDNMNECLPS